MAVRAYVLIQTEVGRAIDVSRAVGRISGVVAADNARFLRALATGSGGAAGAAGKGELDQAIEQLGVRRTRRFPQPGEHRDRREPGDRVHLVHEEAPPVGLEEEVDPGHGLQPARVERSDRQCARRVGVGGLERRGDQELRGAVFVLVGVVVELTAGNDLARDRRVRRVLAQHGDLDLRPTIASSARIHSSKTSACSIAASSSARSRALPTPTDDPMLAGFTKHGMPSSASTWSANVVTSWPSRWASHRGVGRPQAAKARFIITLSMPTAEPRTPLPT